MPEVLLPKEPSLLEPDRVRPQVDETNVNCRDLRDKLWVLMKLASMVEYDRSDSIEKAFVKAARELAHTAELMRMRAVSRRREG